MRLAKGARWPALGVGLRLGEGGEGRCRPSATNEKGEGDETRSDEAEQMRGVLLTGFLHTHCAYMYYGPQGRHAAWY
jgi:hypothetical protein